MNRDGNRDRGSSRGGFKQEEGGWVFKLIMDFFPFFQIFFRIVKSVIIITSQGELNVIGVVLIRTEKNVRLNKINL